MTVAKSDAVKQAEERIKKAKQRLKDLKSRESKARRKERDTAIYNLGACFVVMMRDDQLGESTLKIWRDHMSRIAPGELTDQRRQALKSVFNLDVPDHPVR